MKKIHTNKIILGALAAGLMFSSCNNVLDEVNRETLHPGYFKTEGC